MREQFEEHRFSKTSLALIKTCNEILSEYQAQGYKLSLRQLYYQLVARDYIRNSNKSYKNTGDLVKNARLAGLMDWNMIEDRNRGTHANSHWDSPAAILKSAAYSFHMDRWVGQSNYVEVLVEKDALSGILLPVCRELDVMFTANKGYTSSSAMYEASKRIWREAAQSKSIHIIYLGNHDPSGTDMTRDIRERFKLFTREQVDFEIHRLALNYDQVEMWNPPENPAKKSDSRYQGYADEYGESSWELDAVEPAILAGLVRDQIEALIDDVETWDQVKEKEEGYTNQLYELAEEYKGKE
jgi:hypothetical protein